MKTTVTVPQLSQIIQLIEDKVVTQEQMTRLLASGALAEVFESNALYDDRAAVRRALKLDVAALQSDIFALSVNYRLKLPEMIAAGRYDWVNGDITPKHFPIQGTGEEQLEGKLFHFDRAVSSEAAVEAMKGAGYELARIEHLLVFGKDRPDEQRKYPIVALGSVAAVGGGRCVPCLRRVVVERFLYLLRWDDSWNASYRFLAVRKLSLPT